MQYEAKTRVKPLIRIVKVLQQVEHSNYFARNFLMQPDFVCDLQNYKQQVTIKY